ncbi:MAG: hypothetical protein PWQ57_3323 [Desulfovibrionales bacterium]|jgi:hypothetical protein|nr:hypothetical protein [Desulfovibrionales bacterium]
MTPTRYTPQLARSLCARIANGESLSKVCEDPAMPCRATVYRWLEKKETFRRLFNQSVMLRTDGIFDDFYEKIQSTTEDNAQARRVQLEALKWYLGRMNPTKYGDRQHMEVKDSDGVPVMSISIGRGNVSTDQGEQ